MTRLSASLLFLLSVFASTAHAQITTVQGSPRGYPLPVTVSGTISTPGGATSAKQDAQTALLTAGNASTASIDATLTVVNTKFGAIGQQLAAASAPVVLPAAQVALLAQAAQLPAALVGGRFDVNLGTSSITLPVSMASAPTGAALDATLAKLTIGSSWAYYAVNATTTFVSGAAILRRVTITAASSAGNSCVLYDSTGAATNPIAGFDAQIRGVFEFNAAVSNGITLICAGGTAPQLTAMWN